ncbi:D-alanyl-D-alanine carboxypeptidase family protein [Xylanibacillus composti]|nr:D-alanyl-D-alanine carboxypeptidase family protein [Xylanibacillus composti]
MEQVALAPGESFELHSVLADDTLTVSYHSPDTGIVAIDESGNLTVSSNAVTGDRAVITVQAGQAQAELTVTVKTKLSETAIQGDDGFLIVTNPTAFDVVVNKQRRLPDGYYPDDLVVPNVPFSFSGESEKKKLRKQAAEALEQLFAQAEEDGIALRAVSGFRAFGTQQAIFQSNVQRQGEEEARRYSAYPGTSEHQTGLAMDVSSPSVNNALEDTLGATEEGKWLAENAAAYGFIIRYPEGKEHITGYAYEPWHLRYVGKQVAQQIHEQALTLEEYFEADRPNNL